MSARRFRVLHGMDGDGAGYVVVDSAKDGIGPNAWRGLVMVWTDSKSHAEEMANVLNAEVES